MTAEIDVVGTENNDETVNNVNNKKSNDFDEIMTAEIDVRNERKRFNLMKKLLTNRYPVFMIFDRENLTETTYEDLLCNCIKLEMNLENRNYLLLYQYYRIGFFLSKVKERFENIGFEKQLVSII